MAKDDTPKALLQALDLIRGSAAPQPESLGLVEARHVARVRSIFEDRNIVAIGIAEKRSERKKTGELSLCFYVEKKLARSKVDPNRLVPPVLSVADRAAVFTDVQVIGKLVPQVNKRRTPLSSGYSVGSQTDTGTLGAIVKKGTKYYLLSNSHVLAKSGKGKVGDTILYPGEADTSGKVQKVATLSDIIAFERGKSASNRIDAALAEIDPAFLDDIDFSIRGAVSPLSTGVPARDMKVLIRGRTSGDSEGVVDDIHFTTALPYPGVGDIGFIDQVKCSRYTRAGDSGSLVVDKASGKVVGLHFAGSSQGSLFNPISEVVKALKFRFVTK